MTVRLYSQQQYIQQQNHSIKLNILIDNLFAGGLQMEYCYTVNKDNHLQVTLPTDLHTVRAEWYLQ